MAAVSFATNVALAPRVKTWNFFPSVSVFVIDIARDTKSNIQGFLEVLVFETSTVTSPTLQALEKSDRPCRPVHSLNSAVTVSWMFLIEHMKNTKESIAFTTKRVMVSTLPDPRERVPWNGLTVRTARIEEAVDLVAGDFLNGTSWRRKVGDEQLTDCIIEHAISNALPPQLLAPHRCGWTEVCGFLKLPRPQKQCWCA